MTFAVDTNIWIALLNNEDTNDIQILIKAISESMVYMPPVVFSEVVSDPKLPKKGLDILKEASFMKLHDGYWERSGLLRALLIKKKCKPQLADTLIAQSCIDYDVPLLTRDKGFDKFKKHAGLKLVTK